MLEDNCEYVYIDTDKGIAAAEDPQQAPRTKGKQLSTLYTEPLAPVVANTALYRNVQPLSEVLANADRVLTQLRDALHMLIDQAVSQRLQSLQPLKDVASLLVETMINNPDASLWLIRVRPVHSSPCDYLVRCAMWSLLLGRHLGLPKRDLVTLVLAVLVKDIGVIQCEGACHTQVVVQASHIEPGVNVLKTLSGVPPKMLQIVGSYLERVNGMGVPSGLQGDEIPLLARLAGIACFYESAMHPLGERYARSPSQAMSALLTLRGSAFQDDLVTAFMQAMGLYPTGTLVTLSTGEMAMVTEQHPQRQLKPKVLLLQRANGQRVKKVVVMDLFEDEQRQQALRQAGKKHTAEVTIVQDLSMQYFAEGEDALSVEAIDQMMDRARVGLLKKLRKKSILFFWR